MSNTAILQIHPVTFAGVKFCEVNVAGGIGGLKVVEFLTPLGRDLVALEAAVQLSDLDGKGEVAQTERRGIVGMAGHHGGSGEIIRHARGELINTIATGGIAEDIDAVGIDVLENDQVVDQVVELDNSTLRRFQGGYTDYLMAVGK